MFFKSHSNIIEMSPQESNRNIMEIPQEPQRNPIETSQEYHRNHTGIQWKSHRHPFEMPQKFQRTRMEIPQTSHRNTIETHRISIETVQRSHRNTIETMEWMPGQIELIDKSYSKGKEKQIWNMFTSNQKARHNRGPQQTYYLRSGLLMGYPLEKMFGCCFFWVVLLRNLLC